jgi:hypothetical protein
MPHDPDTPDVMASTTRAVLDKARDLLAQAEAAGPSAHATGDLTPFAANIEAAVIFGRSVTFHLQKEFSHQNEFVNWYPQIQKRLGTNTQFQYLVSARNFILKEGPAPIRRAVQTSLNVSILVTTTLKASVVPGDPWYKRNVQVLHDRFRFIAEEVRNWKLRRRHIRENRAAQAHQTVLYSFYFVDPAVAQVPAQQVVREYLDELETIVADAETRFPTV